MAQIRSADASARSRRMRPMVLATAAAILMASIAMTTQALLHPVPLVAQDPDLVPIAAEPVLAGPTG
jgi:hypothetical protein